MVAASKLANYSNQLDSSSKMIYALGYAMSIANGTGDPLEEVYGWFKLPVKLSSTQELAKVEIFAALKTMQGIRGTVAKLCGKLGDECAKHQVIMDGIQAIMNGNKQLRGKFKRILSEGSDVYKGWTLKKTLKEITEVSLTLTQFVKDFPKIENGTMPIDVIQYNAGLIFQSEGAFNNVLSCDAKEANIIAEVQTLKECQTENDPNSDANKKITAMADELTAISENKKTLVDTFPKVAVDKMVSELDNVKMVAESREQGSETYTGAFDGPEDLDGIVKHTQSNRGILPGNMTEEKVAELLEPLVSLAKEMQSLRASMELLKFSAKSVQHITKFQEAVKAVFGDFNKLWSQYTKLLNCAKELKSTVKFDFETLDRAEKDLKTSKDFKGFDASLSAIQTAFKEASSIYKVLKDIVDLKGDVAAKEAALKNMDLKKLVDDLQKLQNTFKDISDFSTKLESLKDEMFTEEFKNWATGQKQEEAAKCLKDNGGEALTANAEVNQALMDIVSKNAEQAELEIGPLVTVVKEWKKLATKMKPKNNTKMGKKQRHRRRAKRDSAVRDLLEAARWFEGGARVVRNLEKLFAGNIAKVEQFFSNIDTKIGQLTDQTVKDMIKKVWTEDIKNTLKTFPSVLDKVNQLVPSEPAISLNENGVFYQKLVKETNISNTNFKKLTTKLKALNDPQIDAYFGNFKDVVFYKSTDALQFASASISSIYTFLNAPPAVLKKKNTAAPNQASNNQTNEATTKPSESQTGVIIGSVAGTLGFGFVIGGIVYCIIKKPGKKDNDSSKGPDSVQVVATKGTDPAPVKPNDPVEPDAPKVSAEELKKGEEDVKTDLRNRKNMDVTTKSIEEKIKKRSDEDPDITIDEGEADWIEEKERKKAEDAKKPKTETDAHAEARSKLTEMERDDMEKHKKYIEAIQESEKIKMSPEGPPLSRFENARGDFVMESTQSAWKKNAEPKIKVEHHYIVGKNYDKWEKEAEVERKADISVSRKGGRTEETQASEADQATARSLKTSSSTQTMQEPIRPGAGQDLEAGRVEDDSEKTPFIVKSHKNTKIVYKYQEEDHRSLGRRLFGRFASLLKIPHLRKSMEYEIEPDFDWPDYDESIYFKEDENGKQKVRDLHEIHTLHLENEEERASAGRDEKEKQEKKANRQQRLQQKYGEDVVDKEPEYLKKPHKLFERLVAEMKEGKFVADKWIKAFMSMTYFNRSTRYRHDENGEQTWIPIKVWQKILELGKDALNRDPACVKLEGTFKYIGDVHGDFTNLVRNLNAGGFMKKKLIFLGDYVDRGPRSVDVLGLVFLLKIAYPDQVFLLRGNHELPEINYLGGFRKDCRAYFGHKSGEIMYHEFNTVFTKMPIMAFVNDNTLACHGGISQLFLRGEEAFKLITKEPTTSDELRMFYSTLWGDPAYCIEACFLPSTRTPKAKDFSVFAFDEVCKLLKIKLMIRGHQVKEDGFQVLHGKVGKIISIHSTANTKEDPRSQTVNRACSVVAGPDLLVKVSLFDDIDHFNRDFPKKNDNTRIVMQSELIKLIGKGKVTIIGTAKDKEVERAIAKAEGSENTKGSNVGVKEQDPKRSKSKEPGSKGTADTGTGDKDAVAGKVKPKGGGGGKPKSEKGEKKSNATGATKKGAGGKKGDHKKAKT